MVRNVDYEARKKAVLGSAINRYIQRAMPVASDDLAREFDLSSATIRNIFAELEEDSYLTHPHISGGRIPTNKGYRYYVDFLVSQIELLDEDKDHIVNEYAKEINRLEDILEKTSEVISKITHYTSMVSFLNEQDKFVYKGLSLILEQPEFQDLESIRIVLRMLEEKERLLDIINRDFDERVKVYIGEELGCPEMGNCSLIVSGYSLKDKPSGRLAVLGPMRMEYRYAIPKLVYISDVLTEVLNSI